MSGGNRLDWYITDEMPFDKINEAFDRMKSGFTLRVVLNLV